MGTRRGRVRGVFWCVLGILMLWALGARTEPVRVGVIYSSSIEEVPYTSYIRNSYRMALEDFPPSEEKPLELVETYCPNDPREAARMVEHLVREKRVSLLVTGMVSNAAWEVAHEAQRMKIPILVHEAPADCITEQGWEYVFRLNLPASEYVNVLLWFLTEVVRPKTFAFLYAQDLVGFETLSKLKKHTEKARLKLVYEHAYPKHLKNFRPLLKRIRETKPDVLYVASYLDDAVRIALQADELHVRPPLFVGFGGFSLPEFGKRAGKAADYLCAVTLWTPLVPYPGAKRYNDEYQKRYGTPADYHGAEAYAAMQVVLDAIQRAPSNRPSDLRKALADTDLLTIMGPVRFVSYGIKTQQNRLPSYLLQWFNGKAELIWPPRIASHPYCYSAPQWGKR